MQEKNVRGHEKQDEKKNEKGTSGDPSQKFKFWISSLKRPGFVDFLCELLSPQMFAFGETRT